MYCPKCGQQIDDSASTCMYCGHSFPPKVSMNNLVVILVLYLFFPVGLYLMWTRTTWKKSIKIAVTAVFLVVLIALIPYIAQNIQFESTEREPHSSSLFTNESTTEETTLPVPTKSAAELEEEYKASCETIDYKTLARNPDNYKGQCFTLTGEVIQVQEGIFQTVLRINITAATIGEATYYSDTIYAEIQLADGADRILEGDIITVWGECIGLVSYQSIFGQQISVPGIEIAYYELVQ